MYIIAHRRFDVNLSTLLKKLLDNLRTKRYTDTTIREVLFRRLMFEYNISKIEYNSFKKEMLCNDDTER